MFRIVTFVREVEESVVYARTPTIALSSINAFSSRAPEVLMSNAAPIASPGVFAFGPPVPLISRPEKMALVCRFEKFV